jgi:hypothetical protein
MFKKKDSISPMVAVYLPRFSSHLNSNETPLDAGTAYSVGWAMEHGDSLSNGLLVITNLRIFHCIDYGPLTLEVSKTDILKVSSSDFPVKDNMVLHLHFLENDEATYNSFYCSKPFTKDVVRMFK